MADWSDAENDLLAQAYLEMLDKELSGVTFNKAEVNRRLQRATGRGRGAVEYKLQNFSAVLLGLGRPWISGYKPAQKFQQSLVHAALRRLDEGVPALPPVDAQTAPSTSLTIDRVFPVTDADFAEKAVASRRKVSLVVDVAERERRNRALGTFGESLVFDAERRFLSAHGRTDLADAVKWVARDEGDGHGYDIASFTTSGADRKLEVKTTSGWAFTPFYLSENERRVAEALRDSWRVVRVWNTARIPKAFEIAPPLSDSVELAPASYRASFRRPESV